MYAYKFLEGAPEGPEMPYFARGRGVHKVAELYTLHCLAQKVETDITECDAIAAQACEAERVPAEIQGEVFEIARTFVENHRVPLDGEVFVEQRFGGEIDGEQLFGFLDRVHVLGRAVKVTDYKSNWNIASQSDADSDLQLSIYAALAWLHFGHPEEVTCELDFVRHGAVRETVRTEKQIRQTLKMLVAKAREIGGTTEFNGKVGAPCVTCPHTHACPDFQAALELDAALPVTDAEAVKMAESIVALDTQLTNAKTKLKKWCSEHGPVATNGVSTGFRVIETTEWPVEKLVPILQEGKVNLLDYLKADGTAVKKLLKGALRESLEAIRIMKPSTRFDTWKD
jgi:hypothetical protein